MGFNPFVWNNSEPLPGQNISSGQGTILNDIQFLGYGSQPGEGIADPGFIQFPNGLILQWGNTGTLVQGANALVFTALSGPMKAFPNSLFVVIPVVRSPTVTSSPRGIQISNAGFSRTGFTLVSQDALSLGCDFIALGN